MSNPQKENGYTPISNEIMDALARTRIPGTARQILDCILRKTYGWNKKEDIISLSQFVEITGLSKVAVCKSINKLLELNIITKKGNALSLFTQNGKDVAVTYGFQKDYTKWTPLPKKVTLPKKVIDVTQNGNNTLPKMVHTKERIKTNNKTRVPEWLDEKDWKDFLEHRKKLRKPMTQRAEEIFLAKLTGLKEQGYNPRHLLITAIERGWQTVYEPKQ